MKRVLVSLFALCLLFSTMRSRADSTLSGKILFIDKDNTGIYQIFEINRDGSGRTQLTQDAFDHQFPRLSPDGTLIVFERPAPINGMITLPGNPTPTDDPDTNVAGVYVSKLDGSHAVKVADGMIFQIAWMPDGKHLLVQHSGDDLRMNLDSVEPDGAKLTKLKKLPAGVTSFAISPDGVHLAVIAFAPKDNDTALYVTDFDGSNVRKLDFSPDVKSPIIGSDPAWSADGKQIVYSISSDGSSTSDLYIVDVDSAKVTRLTNPPAGQRRYFDSPTFSPDGKQIVFWDTSAKVIDIIDSDGSNQHQLTKGGSPWWVPEQPHTATK